MSAVYENRAKSSQLLYRKPVIYLYDPLLLGIGCRLLWGCKTDELLELYNTHVSSNHLDIGAGTGFFLDNCTFPASEPRIALADQSRTCLEIAARRLARYKPEKYHVSILEPLHIDAPKFDSIGLLNVLHCLPGTMSEKGAAFENIKPLLNSGGVVFGSTVLGKGIKGNLLTVFALNVSNRIGTMSNMEDDLEGLQTCLTQHFSESSVRLVGNEALFWARP